MMRAIAGCWRLASVRARLYSESTARVAADIPDHVSIDLSMNVPPQPVEAALDTRIEHGMAAIHKRSGLSSFLNYQEPGGNEQDREIIRSWLQSRLSGVTGDRIVIYPGSQAAIFNILLSFLKAGDALLTETLTFPGMKVAAAKLGIGLIGVAMDGQGVLPDALAKAIKLHKPKAVYLTPTMHNPTTATMGKTRRKEVADVLRGSSAFLIEDDAYGALDPSQQLLAGLIPEKTFLTISLSKCIAPALRVSFLLTPDRQSALDLRSSLHATCQMAPPLMVALVMEWLRSGEAARIISAIREEATGRQQLAARALRGYPFAGTCKRPPSVAAAAPIAGTGPPLSPNCFARVWQSSTARLLRSASRCRMRCGFVSARRATGPNWARRCNC